MEEHITLTHEMIEQGSSSQGGWNMNQLEALGVTWPPRKGWKARLDGTRIEKASYERFLSLKKRKRWEPQAEMLPGL